MTRINKLHTLIPQFPYHPSQRIKYVEANSKTAGRHCIPASTPPSPHFQITPPSLVTMSRDPEKDIARLPPAADQRVTVVPHELAAAAIALTGRRHVIHQQLQPQGGVIAQALPCKHC